MFPVFESIAVVDGVYQNIKSHTLRVQRTAKALWQLNWPDDVLERQLPSCSFPGLNKCRFLYNASNIHIEIKPYEIRPIHTLFLREAAELYYPFKYTYRDSISFFTQSLSAGEDVLLTANGYLRDTSYANIALLKKGQWYTPESPLLLGTRRHTYLEQGIIQSASIHINHLMDYESISIFNAMIPLNTISLSMAQIQGLKGNE